MTQRAEARDPSVAIVVGGRFVGFDMARALAKRGRLAGIVSAYPKAFRERIPAGRLRWNLFLGIRERIELRLAPMSRDKIEYEAAVRFGCWASRHLPQADVLQAWTGYALESLLVARAAGIPAVAFRASAHIATQASLLREEYQLAGYAADPVYEPTLERETREYAAADYIQVISSFARRSFIEHGVSPQRLLLTPLAVEIGEVTGVPRTPRRGALRVLYLGNISLQKGVHYLLRAARLLPAGTVDVSLIGGVSPDGAWILREFARTGEWKGKVSRHELAALFAEHDVLVLPSVHDGFGAVICEAMAAGLPVIATTNSGGPDVIEDGITGFVVRARSAEEIAIALARLADGPAECEAMGRAAAEAMQERRTWETFTDDMLKAYQSLRSAEAIG